MIELYSKYTVYFEFKNGCIAKKNYMMGSAPPLETLGKYDLTASSPEDLFTTTPQGNDYKQAKWNIICCLWVKNINHSFPRLLNISPLVMLEYSWFSETGKLTDCTRVSASLSATTLCMYLFVCVFMLNFRLLIMLILMVPKHARTYLISKQLVLIIKRVCVSTRYTCGL